MICAIKLEHESNCSRIDNKAHKFEIQAAQLVKAVLFALVRVLKISAGYAHERGPIHALKKKLKTHVLSGF